MAKDSNIGWCDSTINGTSGCDGCELWDGITRRACYAGTVHETRWSKSFAITHPHLYAPTFDVVKMIPGRFAQAAAWSDLTGKDRPEKPWMNGLPRMIFVGDMGDFLSRAVTDEFLEREMMGAIRSEAGKRHVWLLLTKRPGRLARLSRAWGGLPENVIAMTTITDQRTADARIPKLLEVECHHRGVSAEPLWGAVEFSWEDDAGRIGSFLPMRDHRASHFPSLFGDGSGKPTPLNRGIDWLIVGGESGAKRRELDLTALESLADQTTATGTALFVKQDSALRPGQQGRIPSPLWDRKEFPEVVPIPF